MDHSFSSKVGKRRRKERGENERELQREKIRGRRPERNKRRKGEMEADDDE